VYRLEPSLHVYRWFLFARGSGNQAAAFLAPVLGLGTGLGLTMTRQLLSGIWLTLCMTAPDFNPRYLAGHQLRQGTLTDHWYQLATTEDCPSGGGVYTLLWSFTTGPVVCLHREGPWSWSDEPEANPHQGLPILPPDAPSNLPRSAATVVVLAQKARQVLTTCWTRTNPMGPGMTEYGQLSDLLGPDELGTQEVAVQARLDAWHAAVADGRLSRDERLALRLEVPACPPGRRVVGGDATARYPHAGAGGAGEVGEFLRDVAATRVVVSRL